MNKDSSLRNTYVATRVKTRSGQSVRLFIYTLGDESNHLFRLCLQVKTFRFILKGFSL